MAFEAPSVPVSEFLNLLNEWTYGNYAERNKEITVRRLIKGDGIEQLANEYGLTSRQISRIISKCVSTVNQHI